MTQVGGQMMNALVAYNDGQYDAVVDLMKPLRYDILRIGGSNAQVSHLTSYGYHCMLTLEGLSFI